ncbi:hypothetical protein Selin_1803 [Desulfurispirillum indicum S5]|uniref:Cyclase/dehydrase n=1 Tax=Desulfurispirillum indicum (strain ATCC BAA-1389 / DSM 22839 / S5) TaxID=653733 RepID=E6W1B0_DESIS|nr:SRPBCC family protein [Desulfurispirillum indicum]ADU66530.1 hypothetical protein Selin_1803 [Desulfurispirillum indicum S5]
MHELYREIELDAPCEAIWDFIATPRNLNALTPPELQFRIITDLPDTMHNGLTILYHIQVPIFGSHRWLTEIKHIREGISFVDEQRQGPYRFWYHYHEIQRLGPRRCRMVDRVTYALPLGPLGTFVHRLIVRNMLGTIFDYRHQKLLELYPPTDESAPEQPPVIAAARDG